MLFSDAQDTAHNTNDIYSKYLVPLANPVKLNPDMVDGRSVNNFLITPNSLGVVYTSNQINQEKVELFSVFMTVRIELINTNIACVWRM